MAAGALGNKDPDPKCLSGIAEVNARCNHIIHFNGLSCFTYKMQILFVCLLAPLPFSASPVIQTHELARYNPSPSRLSLFWRYNNFDFLVQSSVCCAKECGKCGGPDCGHLPGGSRNCCVGVIERSKVSCDNQGPPCVIAPEPPSPTICGNYPEPWSSTQPNVLIVGDSISMAVPSTYDCCMCCDAFKCASSVTLYTVKLTKVHYSRQYNSPGGYGANVKSLLQAKNITVQHNGGWGKGGQASNTVKGLECTNASTPGYWLNFTGQIDIIHFNLWVMQSKLLSFALLENLIFIFRPLRVLYSTR